MFFLGGPVPPVCHAIFSFLDVLCMFFIPRFSNSRRKASPILMTLTKAVQITKDVLDIFNCYPWLAAVHINCPHRVHTHFLLGCIDLRTGRKLSQSKRDLLQFKEHYNSIAKKHGIPLVRGYGLEQPQSLAEEDVSNEIVSDVVTIDSSPLYVTNYPNPVTPPPHQGNDAGSILTDFKKDFAMYFSFGYGRSG